MISASPDSRKSKAEATNAVFTTRLQRYVPDNMPLQAFFDENPNATEILLSDRILARHLCRPSQEVWFGEDGITPSLAPRELELYEAMQQAGYPIALRVRSPEWMEKSSQMRYERLSQTFGSMNLSGLQTYQLAESLARDGSKRAVAAYTVEDALHYIATECQKPPEVGPLRVYGFHARCEYADKGHFIAGAVIVDPAHPEIPKRIIFSDSDTDYAYFKGCKKQALKIFPRLEADQCLEVSHDLQGISSLRDSGPHLDRIGGADVNCSLYAFSTARALLHLPAKQLVEGTEEILRDAMASHMPDYYVQPHLPGALPKTHDDLMERNMDLRWETGRGILRRLCLALTRVQEQTR